MICVYCDFGTWKSDTLVKQLVNNKLNANSRYSQQPQTVLSKSSEKREKYIDESIWLEQ